MARARSGSALASATLSVPSSCRKSIRTGPKSAWRTATEMECGCTASRAAASRSTNAAKSCGVGRGEAGPTATPGCGCAPTAVGRAGTIGRSSRGVRSALTRSTIAGKGWTACCSDASCGSRGAVGRWAWGGRCSVVTCADAEWVSGRASGCPGLDRGRAASAVSCKASRTGTGPGWSGCTGGTSGSATDGAGVMVAGKGAKAIGKTGSTFAATRSGGAGIARAGSCRSASGAPSASEGSAATWLSSSTGVDARGRLSGKILPPSGKAGSVTADATGDADMVISVEGKGTAPAGEDVMGTGIAAIIAPKSAVSCMVGASAPGIAGSTAASPGRGRLVSTDRGKDAAVWVMPVSIQAPCQVDCVRQAQAIHRAAPGGAGQRRDGLPPRHGGVPPGPARPACDRPERGPARRCPS